MIERLRERTTENAVPVEKIPVVAGGGTELLDFDQVHYAQADGDYSRVHTYDRSYLCTASLGELEERLGTRFARIHRSYLVNLGKVAGVRRAAPDRFRLQLADAEQDRARRGAPPVAPAARAARPLEGLAGGVVSPGRAARPDAASSVSIARIEAPCVLASERPSHPGRRTPSHQTL